jgi:drug/metabolite transporter (DMT)-like permease
MNWIHFCLLTIVLYGIHDIALKQVADTVNSTVASVLINASAAVTLFLYLVLQPGAEKWRVGGTNLAVLFVAGVSLGVATITFMNAFNRGGNLSIATPVVYSGVIGVCMLAGLVFYKETLDWRQWAGAGLAVAGIYLMAAGK